MVGALVLVAAIGVPLLIAAVVPARRRLVAMAAWVASPLLVFAVVAAVETVRDPAAADPGKLLFAFGIIASYAAVPWLVACAVGYGLGTLLRRRRPAAAPPPAVPSPSRPQRPPPAPPRGPGTPLPGVGTAAGRHVAPDGSVLVDLAPVEWAASVWVLSPKVTDHATGRVVLDLHGTEWDAAVAFPRPRTVWLGLRGYRSGAEVPVELDLAADRYVIARDRRSGTLADLPVELAAHAAAMAFVGPPPNAAAAPPKPAYGAALAILVGALLAIAALSYLAVALQAPPARPPLDRIPAMPRAGDVGR